MGQTQSSIKTLWAPLAIRSTQSLENKSLQLDAKHTSTPVTDDREPGQRLPGGRQLHLRRFLRRTPTTTPTTASKGVKGTGTGKYKTFTLLVKKMFSGKGETSYDDRQQSATATAPRTRWTPPPVTKDTKNTTTAQAAYNFTTIETRTDTVTVDDACHRPGGAHASRHGGRSRCTAGAGRAR